MVFWIFFSMTVVGLSLLCLGVAVIIRGRLNSRPLVRRSRGLKYDIYLAGPMRGLENKNKEQFAIYAALLRKLGHRVFSPAEFNDDDMTYEECMYIDVNAVVNKCKWVCVLPNWGDSVGTNVEVFVANSCGIPVMELFMYSDGSVGMEEFDSEKFCLPYCS